MLKLALSLGVFTSSALVVTSLVGSPHGTQDSIRPSAANAADDTVEVRVAYPYGALFTDVHEQISEQFEQENPGIDIILEAPLANYEELAQRTLVGITQNNAPTLSFQGINQVRQFVDAGHTNDLSEFASSDPNWGEAGGYYPSMMELGEFNGRQHAIPFAVSTPIMYYNADLFRAAGLDPENPPTEWPDVIAAVQAIDALGDDTEGLWYNYLITGNWNYQALVYSEGGSMMTEDESAVAFSGDPGVRAAQLIRSFVDKAGMPDWSADQGEQSFVSGSVGIYFTSTSNLALLQNGAQFELRTALFPLSST
ncbi:MAG: extracellular solute-binding protein, partial [Cyanobacteria bacterium J06555_12]